MNATARPAPVSDLFKPFVRLAALAFGAGFVGVMALTGTSVLAQLGELPGQRDTASVTEPVASPATVAGPASGAWHFPKAI